MSKQDELRALVQRVPGQIRSCRHATIRADAVTQDNPDFAALEASRNEMSTLHSLQLQITKLYCEIPELSLEQKKQITKLFESIESVMEEEKLVVQGKHRQTLQGAFDKAWEPAAVILEEAFRPHALAFVERWRQEKGLMPPLNDAQTAEQMAAVREEYIRWCSENRKAASSE
jgi:hypothetical protein